METKTDSPSAGREMVLTRHYQAPRALVYKAWTDPAHIDHWWGPAGFRNETFAMTVAPGGRWRFVMHAPDGVDYPNDVAYLEVVENERLVYDHGKDLEAEPPHFRVTVSFSDEGEGTLVTMRSEFPTAEALEAVKAFGAVELGHQTLARLVAYLPVLQQQLVITREFDAPLALVYKAWTEAERLAQWWGPKGFGMTVAKLDLRAGGMFHYAMTPPNSSDAMWGKFVYVEVAAPERIVFISSFSDAEGNTTRNPWAPIWPLEVINTLTFSEKDGKTTVMLVGGPHNASEEERAAFAAAHSNVQQGFKGTFDQLEAYLKS